MKNKDNSLHYWIYRSSLLIICLYLIISIQPVSSAAEFNSDRCSSKWTFMIFLNGDNNLEEYAINDFIEMAKAGSTNKVNIIVQMDRRSGYDSSYGDWAGTKRFKVIKDMIPIPASAVEDIGEANMGDPQTIIDFVGWTKINYRAEHYALIIWDHGSGWRRDDYDPPVKSISSDYTDSDEITMPELRQALAAITNNGTDKLDIIGFDACLMAMEEVDYQIMPYARYRVSSEEVEPLNGWDYAASMTYLINNQKCTSQQLSAQIVSDYINYTGTSGYYTLSAVNLNNLNDLVTATSKLGNDLMNVLPLYRIQIEEVNDRVECFPYYNYGFFSYIDLHDFARLISESINDPVIINDAHNVMDAIANTVIAEAHGSTHANSRGISIYLPDPRYDVYSTNYETDMVFSNDTQWDEFLRMFSDRTPPTRVIDLHSTSHLLNTWSTDCTIDINWTAAQDTTSGLNGYSIQWSHFSDTLPDKIKNIEYNITNITSQSLSTANDWYFHIRSVDNAGNWNDTAAHLGPFYVDNNTPFITSFAPDNPVIDIKNATRKFSCTVNQVVDVVWMINNRTLFTNTSIRSASYTNTSAVVGIWNISAIANNTNGTDIQTWQWNVTAMSVCNLNTTKYFKTIQDALDDAYTLNGHIIVVDPGTYSENVKVNKEVTIRSTSGDPADTIIQANNSSDHVFYITADYVNISGFTVIGAMESSIDTGIYINEANYCELSNNNTSKNSCGIFLFCSNHVILTNNTVNLNYDCGISLISSDYNHIYNNYFNNTNNAYDSGINTWNSTLTSNTNIINGSYIGGNYWSDYTGFDTSGDGLGDEPYNISGGSNQDHLPLVYDMCGDVDEDRDVDVDDVHLLLDHIFTGTAINECAGDVDESGGINMLDVRLLMNHVADRVGYELNCICKRI